MKGLFVLANIFAGVLAFTAAAQETYERDIIETPAGNLEITFIGHGTLMFTFGGKVIHVDPWTKLANYARLPKADIILLTHEHMDHCGESFNINLDIAIFWAIFLEQFRYVIDTERLF